MRDVQVPQTGELKELLGQRSEEIIGKIDVRVLAIVDPPHRYCHQGYTTHHKMLLVPCLITELVYQAKRGFRVAFGVADDG